MKKSNRIEITAIICAITASVLWFHFIANMFYGPHNVDIWSWHRAAVSVIVMSIPLFCWGAFALTRKDKVRRWLRLSILAPVVYLIALVAFIFYPQITNEAADPSKWTIYPPLSIGNSQ